MNEVVTPLYLSFACLFLGLTVAAQPSRDRRLQPSERMGPYGVLGGVVAALACTCIALAPFFGRPLLALSTLFLWTAFTAMACRARSWQSQLTRRCSFWSLMVLLAASGLMTLQGMLDWPLTLRVWMQLIVSVFLLGWLLLELVRVRRQVNSYQLDLMQASVLGMLLVLAVWAWALLSGHALTVLNFPGYFSEGSLAFAMRLFVVSLLALMLISANGYGLEHMVRLKSSLSDEKAQADHMNQQLQRLLHEKNEMLQMLSFGIRSQNLPVIMSSLSHEINQPLGAIRLNAEHLLAVVDKMAPAERIEMLKQMADASVNAATVVQDFRRLLEVSDHPHVHLDLSLLLTNLMRIFDTEFGRQKAQVQLKESLAVHVKGDPIQLESAFSAALQHLLARGSRQDRRLQIEMIIMQRHVQVRMLDNGQPWSQSELEQAFVRPLSGMPDRFRSNLWLCRAIIEHHGGSVQVYQDPGCSGIGLQLPLLES